MRPAGFVGGDVPSPVHVSEYTLRHSASTLSICNQEYEAARLKRFGAALTTTNTDTAALVLLAGVHVAGDGLGNVVQDSFLPCFEPQRDKAWNWALHLLPPWILGVVLRFCVLLPLRVLLLLTGMLVFCVLFFSLQLLCPRTAWRQRTEARLVQFLASSFVVSWSGVVKYHGSPPDTRRLGKNAIFVANHTSMIDMVVLAQLFSFAVVGQKHGGWVGVLQTKVLSCLQSVWFDRGEMRDKIIVRQKLRAQVSDVTRHPLLVFPEGTCVNNQYVIQFKQGVFELDAPIAPIAIKYNKTFVDAFWNSRGESFTQHLVRLMSSWAVVCDVWFLEPQLRNDGESAADFADRVKKLIAHRAGLKVTSWDGYMKHYRPSERYVEEQRKFIAGVLRDLDGEGREDRRIKSFLDLNNSLTQRRPTK